MSAVVKVPSPCCKICTQYNKAGAVPYCQKHHRIVNRPSFDSCGDFEDLLYHMTMRSHTHRLTKTAFHVKGRRGGR